MGPGSNDWCPQKRRDTQTQARVSCEDRAWSDSPTSQGRPRAAGSYQKLEGQCLGFPRSLPEGTSLLGALTLDFWPPEQ